MALTLNPYLFFTGNCREAMEFYQGVFGGQLDISEYEDFAGMEGMQAMESMKGKVMNAALSGGAISFMASDSTRDKFEESFVSLSLNGTEADEEQLRGYFDALSEGGSKIEPIKVEVWGDQFGSLTDKFGVDWMVNISKA